MELTKLGLIPYRGLNPLRRPRGKLLAHPSSALTLHSPSSTTEVSSIHQISPPLQRSRMGRRKHREVQPSPLPSPKILAQP